MRILVAAALAGCGFTPPASSSDALGPDAMTTDTPDATAWLPGYDFRKKLEVTTGITATLADFPVGIAVTDADLAAHARSDGTDLVVTAGDGLAILDVELVRYDAGEVELWARVPSLPPSTTPLYLYYGGAATASRSSTWGPQFAGVWHLSQPGPDAPDSTSHTNNLAPISQPATPTDAAGIAGHARSLDGDDSLDAGDPSDGSLDFATASFSYTTWIFQTQVSGPFDMPFYKGGPSAGQPGYCLILGSGQWQAKVHDGTAFVDPSFGDEPSFANRWVHLAAVVDRATATFSVYADGAFVTSQSLAQLGELDTANPFAIGRGNDAAFRGRVDEARIYNVALSADWIAAEHANHTAETFLVIGAHETP
jgi:hypothetical protein